MFSAGSRTSTAAFCSGSGLLRNRYLWYLAGLFAGQLKASESWKQTPLAVLRLLVTVIKLNRVSLITKRRRISFKVSLHVLLQKLFFDNTCIPSCEFLVGVEGDVRIVA